MGLTSYAFNGAFFAWPYQAGVAAHVQERGLLDEGSRVYGTSSGAVVAVMLACGIDIANVGMPAGLEANAQAKGNRFLPFFKPTPVLPIYFAIFCAALPADAHVRASGKLFISVTQVPRFKRATVSQYSVMGMRFSWRLRTCSTQGTSASCAAGAPIGFTIMLLQ